MDKGVKTGSVPTDKSADSRQAPTPMLNPTSAPRLLFFSNSALVSKSEQSFLRFIYFIVVYITAYMDRCTEHG